MDARSAYAERASILWAPYYGMLYFANVFFIFLWPPYSPALVNGGSRKFYTWCNFEKKLVKHRWFLYNVCHVW